jgi:hypothetical protein
MSLKIRKNMLFKLVQQVTKYTTLVHQVTKYTTLVQQVTEYTALVHQVTKYTALVQQVTKYTALVQQVTEYTESVFRLAPGARMVRIHQKSHSFNTVSATVSAVLTFTLRGVSHPVAVPLARSVWFRQQSVAGITRIGGHSV